MALRRNKLVYKLVATSSFLFVEERIERNSTFLDLCSIES